jgi:hypothetical protein
LDLIGVVRGSTALLFRKSQPQQPFAFPESEDHGAIVVSKIVSVIKSLSDPKKKTNGDIDPGVLDNLKRIGDLIGRRSISEVRLDVPRLNGSARIGAIYDEHVHKKIMNLAKAPREQEMIIEGRLEMADFKETGKVCRLHPPLGQAVQCTFDPEKEDEVYASLRKPVRLIGRASLNPNTGKVEELHINRIELLEDLMVGARDFFIPKTLQHLADTQGIKPLTRMSALEGGWPDDEDIDKFLEDVYLARSN